MTKLLTQTALLICTSLLSLNSQAEGGAPAFDPGLPPPAVSADYFDHARKIAIQINIAPSEASSESDELFYSKLLNNVSNYYAAVTKGSSETPDVRVIIHGDGIRMLLAAQNGTAPKLASKIDALLAKPGIKIQLCYNTLLGKKIPVSALYKISEENLIPAGVAEIARLQGMGFAYLKL